MAMHSAFRWLGWAAGEISLAIACIVSYYTSYQLAVLHHYENARHNRYRDLGRAIFGMTTTTHACHVPPVVVDQHLL